MDFTYQPVEQYRAIMALLLAVPKLIIRSDKLSYCLSMTQPNIATSLIEKEPMNTQVGLFLDKLEFQ